MLMSLRPLACRFAVTIALGAFVWQVASVRAEDWPQFRGPNCSGISSSKRPLPTTFSAEENVRWSARLGDGTGSPVVAAGRVFVSAMTADETVSLFAFDVPAAKREAGCATRCWPTLRQ